jgi:two-component system, chemotaxis family, sensor kinase CheA
MSQWRGEQPLAPNDPGEMQVSVEKRQKGAIRRGGMHLAKSNKGSSKKGSVSKAQPKEDSFQGDVVAGPGMSGVRLTLDDILAQLLQLEPENTADLGQVHSMIDALSSTFSGSGAMLACLNNALARLEGLIQGSSADPAGDMKQTMDFLDAARKLQEQQETAGPELASDSPEPPGPVKPVEFASESVAESPKASLPEDADAELIGEFINECKDLLEKAEAAMLLLETNPDNMDSVNTVFRTFHTIKGTSGFLGLLHIQAFAHLAESLLSRVRDREIRFAGIFADLALRSTDVLKELTEGVQKLLGGEEAPLPSSYEALMNQLVNPEAAAGLEETTTVPVPAPAPDPKPALASAPAASAGAPPEKAAEAGAEPVEPEQKPAPVGTPPVKNGSAEPFYAGAAPKTQRRAGPATDAESSLRVRTDRLDRLVDMVGELVIAQSMLSQDSVVHQSGNHDLLRKVTHAGKIIRELQDLAMSMRMVPLRGTFQKVARLVRDLAHKSGKVVEFVGEGEETEIDRNMVDVLGDPLVHMVRNAIDHGIEPPDIRAARGKPQAGTIRLSAYHSGGNVVLELKDDGKGLDRAKIVEKAMSKGLLESESNLSDAEALQLIFLPGFSTADKLTEISGRGVGMDVVKKNVEALRGRVDLVSQAGKGCTFFVRLPLTLAITDGMLVKVGAERYIIPTVNIHLSFKPEKSALWTVSGRGEMVMLRGELMPVFRLHALFDIQGAVFNPTEGLLVVVGEGGRRCALLVDELIGQHQVVAKSLGEGLAKVQGIAGGAILGDGRVGLILDTGELVSLARQSTMGGIPSHTTQGLSAA